MTEPATGTAIAIAAITATLGSWWMGLDGNAVVGALAGGVCMVVAARDLTWWSRVLYLAISTVMGYLAAPELIDHVPIEQTGVAAFICATLIVPVTLQTIERAKHWDIASLLSRKGSP